MNEDFVTETGCTVRLRMPTPFDERMVLIYDMGPEDGRFAELMLTADEARRLASGLTRWADFLDGKP